MLSSAFLYKYADLFKQIAEDCPEFWQDLANELTRIGESQVFARTLVQLSPRVETDTPTGTRKDMTSQTTSAVHDAIVQNESKSVGIFCGRTSDENSENHRDESIFGDTLNPEIDREKIEACWNCASPEHFARTCPFALTRIFCFRCGKDGVTVKHCPNCREGWLAQGPYIPGKGHRGPNSCRDGRRSPDED